MAKPQIGNIINALYLTLLTSSILALIMMVLIIFSYHRVLLETLVRYQPPASQFATSALFKDCQTLSNQCNNNNSDCQYSSLCNFAENYANCRVYDCGKSYGVEINTSDGKLLTKSYEKPEMNDVKKASTACQGTMKITNDKCEDGSIRKITAKVATAGDCQIETFTYQQNGSLMPAAIATFSGDAYTLTIPSCDSPVIISAIGGGGRLIGSATLNK